MERFGLIRTEDPDGDVVSVADCKVYLRLEISDDDGLLGDLIDAAVDWVESYIGRALLTQTWELSLDCFPEVIRLPWQPLQVVNSIKYYDYNNVLQTVASNNYIVDTKTARITPLYGSVWPTIQPRLAAVVVNYDTGYGTSVCVPKAIQQAIKYFVAHQYENRMPVISSGAVPQQVPFTVLALLAPFIVGECW